VFALVHGYRLVRRRDGGAAMKMRRPKTARTKLRRRKRFTPPHALCLLHCKSNSTANPRAHEARRTYRAVEQQTDLRGLRVITARERAESRFHAMLEQCYAHLRREFGSLVLRGGCVPFGDAQCSPAFEDERRP